METQRRRLLHADFIPVSKPLDALDEVWLRQRFSELFDRSGQAIHRAGYDLDDVVVDRIIICVQCGGSEWQEPAEPLSDVRRMKERIRQRAASHSLTQPSGESDSEVQVVRIGVEAYLE